MVDHLEEAARMSSVEEEEQESLGEVVEARSYLMEEGEGSLHSNNLP